MSDRARLLELLSETLEALDWEIARYRWRQHRLLGYDIGWRRAVEEWMAIGFPAWRHRLWRETVRQTGPATTAGACRLRQRGGRPLIARKPAGFHHLLAARASA
jgi:hypothetical protein